MGKRGSRKDVVLLRVDVLGTQYTVQFSTQSENPLLEECDGYCDPSVHLCVVRKFGEPKGFDQQDLDSVTRKNIRHELIHAFLSESGLWANCDWAKEEMVDWLAIQFPKLLKAFTECKCAE